MGVQQALAGMFGMFSVSLPSSSQRWTQNYRWWPRRVWRVWRERVKIKIFEGAGALPFDASPNWNMQGAPGMAEKPGIPHEEWCWLDFFLPSLSWNKHSAGRTRILLLHTARAGVPYRHHLLLKNQPETPAAVGQCLQLPQARSPHLPRLLGKERRALQVLGGKKTSTCTLWCCFTSSQSCQRLSLPVLELRHTLGQMEICFLKWHITGNEFSAPQLPLWSTQLRCHEQHWNHPQIFQQGC